MTLTTRILIGMVVGLLIGALVQILSFEEGHLVPTGNKKTSGPENRIADE